MNQIFSKTDYERPEADLSPLKAHAARRDQSPAQNSQDQNQTRPESPARLEPLEPAQSKVRAPGHSDNPDNPVKPQTRPSLNEADLRLLQRLLSEGDAALARRSDVIELHKRIIKLFETLNQGVGDMYVAKAEQDRSMLSTRIDGLEDAVNRMEGALRIEFEPVLRQTLSQVVAEQNGVQPARRGRGLWIMTVLIAGLALGSVFHAQITATVSELETYVSTILLK
jgi:hypothetical protein